MCHSFPPPLISLIPGHCLPAPICSPLELYLTLFLTLWITPSEVCLTKLRPLAYCTFFQSFRKACSEPLDGYRLGRSFVRKSEKNTTFLRNSFPRGSLSVLYLSSVIQRVETGDCSWHFSHLESINPFIEISAFFKSFIQCNQTIRFSWERSLFIA